MFNYDASNKDFIQQLRGLVNDALDKRINFGTVLRISPTGLDVAVGATGNILRNLPAIGGSTAVSVGMTVYLLYFGQQAVVLGTGDFSNIDAAASFQSAGEGATHTHEALYYNKSTLDGLLSVKADLSHEHSPSHIEALSGTIGGWEIGDIDLSNDNAFISARGFVGFGDPPPEAYGNTVGAWLGIDPTDMLAKMSLYADASHYLQFNGSDIALSGTIYAQAGEFQGSVQVGTGSPHILIDGANALIRSSNYSAGVAGWQIDKNGDAEFNNLIARGSIKTVVFEKALVSAFAGSQIVAKNAAVLDADFTITAGAISTSLVVRQQAGAAPFVSGDRLRITDGTTVYWIEPTATGAASGDNWVWTSGQLAVLNGSGTVTYEAGLTLVAYVGSGGGGWLYMTADDAEGPFYSVRTSAGSPWSDGVERVRMGNLKNWDGTATDRYGIGIGDFSSDNYLRYEPSTGFVIVAGTGGVTISSGGLTFENDGTALRFKDTSGGTGNLIDMDANNDFYMANAFPGGEINLRVKTTDLSTNTLNYREDPVMANRIQLAIPTGTVGNKFTMLGSPSDRIFEILMEASSSTPRTTFYIKPHDHTTLTASTEAIDIHYKLTHTVQHATGALTTQRAFVIEPPTYSFVGASVVTQAATLAITGAPTAGTNATLTNAYALWVQAGATRLAGTLTASGLVTASSGLTVTGTTSLTGNTSVLINSSTGSLNVEGTAANHGYFQVRPDTQVGPSTDPMIQVLGRTGTNLTASLETAHIYLDLNPTLQFATGAKTDQSAIFIKEPSYSAVGATTTTNASTLTIRNAPTASTNMTITNAYALWIQAGNVRFANNLSMGGSISGTIPLGARAYHNVGQSIANNTLSSITFNSDRWDTDNVHANTQYLTCRTAGKYLIVCNLDWQANAVGRRVMQFVLNATTNIAVSAIMASPTFGTSTSLTTIYDLAVNDTVEVQVLQQSGGALNIESNGNRSPEFMMVRIA